MEPYTKTRPHGYIRRPYAAYIRGAPGGPANFTKVNWNVVNVQDVLSGEKNPRWRAAVRAGTQAGTNLTATRVTVESTPTSATFSRVRNGGTDTLLRRCQYDFLSLGQMSCGDVPFSLKQIALGKFYSKVQDHITPIKGGTILGELVKTVRTLKRPLESMDKLIRDYGRKVKPLTQRGRRGLSNHGRREVHHRINEAYLKFTYGWTPLASDVRSLFKYSSRSDVYSHVKMIWTNEESEVATQYSEVGGINQDVECGDLWAVGGDEETHYQCKVRGVARAAVDASPAKNVAADFGVLPRQWAPTIWEVLPFSFLVDYFSNVGDVVNALSVPRASISWIVATDRTHRRLTSNGRAHVGNSWTQASGTCSHTVHSYKVVRTVYDGSWLPIPMLALQMPNLKQSLNSLSLALAFVRGITLPLPTS